MTTEGTAKRETAGAGSGARHWLVLVVAATAVSGALAYLPDVKPTAYARIDLAGAVLASLGVFGLVFGFSRAETDGWSSGATIGSLAIGVALLVSFVLAERKVMQPLLPLRVVTDRSRATTFTPARK